MNYLSGGLLGDFIFQLSIIKENYLIHGERGNLFLYSDYTRGGAWAFGVEKAFNDTKDIILQQQYINDYQIYNNQYLAEYVDLSDWRANAIVDKTSYYTLFKNKYGVEWGKHKWLSLPNETKYSGTILMSASKMRINEQFNYNNLKKYNKPIYFATTNIDEYTNFKNVTVFNIPVILFPTLLEFWTAINSCYLYVSTFGSFLCASYAMNKENITLLPGSGFEWYVPEPLSNFYWYKNNKENYCPTFLL